MNEKIAIVGLGYVGLPLATIFASKFDVTGFDIKQDRINELNDGKDHTGEVTPESLKQESLRFTADAQDLSACSFIIVAVPTPIDDNNEPDLTPVRKATETVASFLKPGMMVVFESTVYPGVTEDVCLPILEEISGLKLGEFDLGYSPERVNPGDKNHTIDKIVKVVSGHSDMSRKRAALVYGAIVTAGIHEAATIKTAEAAKIIENVQRDLNIALMNELSKIFEKLDIHTPDVIEAAGTKWNFHKYNPGLVGGHCIGVDPYYLTRRAIDLGYEPEVILSGRRINDGMGAYVAGLAIQELEASGIKPEEATVWIMGLTFKENVPDFRNTRATDIIAALEEKGVNIIVWEPLVDAATIEEKFGKKSVSYDELEEVDAAILVNKHEAFSEVCLDGLKVRLKQPILIDVKNYFDHKQAKALGYRYKSL